MVSAIGLLGFTGCSSVDARAGKESYTALIAKMDQHPNQDEGVVAANRNFYQTIE